ncbi:MAG: hypothetical protein V2J10_00305 [Wenzhouxiangella sp.]|jgi:hypothetical protein|nr:hypothetical protein [Wenzhouxiangella sp.]
MSLISKLTFGLYGRTSSAGNGADAGPTTEQGRRPSIENWMRRELALANYVDFELRGTIMRIRYMDRVDPRVKKIHARTARAAAKGGLRLHTSSGNTRLIRAWKKFERKLHLNSREKLESDLRGFMIEGSLPLQWVLSTDHPEVVGCVRLPTETLVPLVDKTGRFEDPAKAWRQINPVTGEEIAHFALYQLTVGRLTPDNFDDWGCLGRPYLDSTRVIWNKLRMTEDDQVLRRRSRAPLRMHHHLGGVSKTDLEDYRAQVEKDQLDGNYSDYYTNSKEASIQPISGDTNLDQIADVAYLMDTFLSGSPMPKGLLGYTEGLSRDILEDIKRDFFDELDSLQDLSAQLYEFGFRLDLLLAGINPDSYEFSVGFAERNVESLNQRADRALKYRAIGVPDEMVWEAAGLDPAAVRKQREAEGATDDPYPGNDPGRPAAGARVSITPGNDRKGDSGTAISNA